MPIPVLTVPMVKSIIIADDDWDDQLMLKETISDHDFAPAVKTVSDGSQLMRMILTEPLPDLILLDLNMPNKNGLECLAEIRSDIGLRNIPVVVLSTSKDIRDIESCYAKGANLFFSKPYTFGSLKTLVHSILKIDWVHFPKQMDKSEFIRITTLGLTKETVA
jgi:CheY-like chemotaxis protein